MLVTRSAVPARSALGVGPVCAARDLQPVWRAGAALQQLQPQRRRRQVAAAASPEDDLDQQLQQDLERMRQRQAAANGSTAASPAAARSQAAQAAGSSGGDGPLSGVKDAVDKVLIADFFFILFALAWLGAALAERSALHSTHLLDTWLALWQWVFQPAIGVLMLGALVSGAAGWAKENLGQSQR